MSLPPPLRAPLGRVRAASRRLLLLGALLGSAMAARAEEDFEDEPPRPVPEVEGPVFREVRSIPYPAGAVYLERGITGAFLGGKYQNLGDDQSLYQWQGELGFYYTRWFSAGLAFKINAGEPNQQEQKVFNRYYAHARFHKDWTKVAIYAGPQIGVDNLNILSGTPDKDSVVGAVIEDPINNTNAGLGLESGMGWKFARWGGATLGAIAEYSLVGTTNSFFGNDLNLRVVPGLAIDVLAFTDTLRELVPAMYVNLEFQVGFLLLQRGRKNNDQAFMLGVGLAF